MRGMREGSERGGKRGDGKARKGWEGERRRYRGTDAGMENKGSRIGRERDGRERKDG